MPHLEQWLRHTRKKGPLAVIFGGSANGLCFVRSLGRRSLPTLLLNNKMLPGMYTKYGRVHRVPEVDDTPADLLAFLDSVASHLDEKGVIFATSDAYVLFLSRYRERLRSSFRFLVPDYETTKKIVNKRFQYSIAEAAGIALPKTLFPKSLEEAQLCASEITYPCILKPYSYVGRKTIAKKVVLIHSSSQLLEEFSRVHTQEAEFMVQEVIPGEDTALFGYYAFWDVDGRERAWITKQKLRQQSAFGDGSYQVTVDAPKVADLGRQFLGMLKYRGFVSVEFKLDPRDQTYRFIEMNPRTPMNCQNFVTAGLDLPWIAYHYLTGCRADGVPDTTFRRGIKYVNEEIDIIAFLTLRRTGKLRFGSWLRSVIGAEAKAFWAVDDPRPFLIVAWRLVKTGFKRILFSRS